MAVTSIHSVRTTLSKSIQYIVDGNKTRNGELVISSGCISNAQGAAEQFAQIRACGTGRSTVLAQHIIQSFKPDEITPENAHRLGLELCEKLLGNDYQYILATHCDHEHIHNHIIFNNTNMFTGKTFETEHNQGKKSWKKLREISDELCRKHCLSVIENPENNKGKDYYEWDMNRQGISWKAKLKYAIDQVIKASEDFEDFLCICRERGIEVSYNPDHKIDLKFRLSGQQKFTRSRTLGWYYETAQISKRIKLYKEAMNSQPKTDIVRTDTERMEESPALQHWADIHNMQETAKALNTLTKYTEKDKRKIENNLMGCHMCMGALADKMDKHTTIIDDLAEKIKIAKRYIKLKPVNNRLKSLTGREKKRFEKENQADIIAFQSIAKQMKELFPDGNAPTPESMENKMKLLIAERSKFSQEYKEVRTRAAELEKARKTIEEYLHNERTADRKRKRQLE